MNYVHTQRGPLHYLLHSIGLAMLAVAVVARDAWPTSLILTGAAALMILFGLMFKELTVRDEGEFLQLEFGPLPVFQCRIPYRDIESVQAGRSSIIDGWGIHTIPGRGSTYNLWGFDCAVLTVKGRTLRIGSDDVANLVRLLESKRAQQSSATGSSPP